jgi:hypothetical protein
MIDLSMVLPSAAAVTALACCSTTATGFAVGWVWPIAASPGFLLKHIAAPQLASRQAHVHPWGELGVAVSPCDAVSVGPVRCPVGIF